jgi:uncharacterized protein YaaR (DUF327 family)
MDTVTAHSTKSKDGISDKVQQLLDASKLYYQDPTDHHFSNLVHLVEKVSESGQSLKVARVFQELLAFAELAERQHRVRRQVVSLTYDEDGELIAGVKVIFSFDRLVKMPFNCSFRKECHLKR